MGRWSRLVAREFIAWLGVERDARWLDVGCGTGALTEAILRAARPVRVTAVDASAAYVATARQRAGDRRAVFAVGDALALPSPSASGDAAVSGLMLNFVPHPGRAVSEMARVVRDGGTAAAYVWDYAGRMELLRHFWDAAVALDPTAAELDEGRRFPICNAGGLDTLFRGAGLSDVEARAIDVPTGFRDFDDYWRPFLGGQGPAPGYVTSLRETARARLRDRLRHQLPTAPDGSIDLVVRAWAVRGRR